MNDLRGLARLRSGALFRAKVLRGFHGHHLHVAGTSRGEWAHDKFSIDLRIEVPDLRGDLPRKWSFVRDGEHPAGSNLPDSKSSAAVVLREAPVDGETAPNDLWVAIPLVLRGCRDG